jgi:hypothetical protein
MDILDAENGLVTGPKSTPKSMTGFTKKGPISMTRFAN